MGRTHEALERAEKDYMKAVKTSPTEALRFAKGRVPGPVSSQNGKEHYQTLKANLFTLYADKTIRTIIFCSTDHGEGATTTATNFAATLATDPQSKVLIVDANLRTPGLHDMCQIDYTPGLADYVGNGKNLVFPFLWKGWTNLYVLPCGSHHSGPVSLFEAKRFSEFLQEMREQFDYVILDGPPLPRFSEIRVICAKVDGVVLVVKAGQTRREVALRAKKEVEDAGGKILGVVINRRKFYIPEWIYKRL
jgi:capsular exopolysaccharide synthesis family protein